MKKTTGILGCALVAGLMTFASGKAQAKDLVVSNEVYATFNLKISTQFVDQSNKLKKASITSKQYLKDLGFNENKVQLAVNTTTFDVWVINQGTLQTNLTAGGLLSVELFDQQTATNNTSSKEAGLIEVFTDAEQLDTFDIGGVYSRSFSFSKVDKNGEQNYKDSLKGKNLSGSGFFSGLSTNNVPVTGSADYKGSGKVTPVL